MSEICTRDTSLRAITEARGAAWHGPHSMWAVTDAAPLNVALPLGLPPAPPTVVRHAPARGARGRMHPPAPGEPSRPSSSRAPAAGEGRRRNGLHTVYFFLVLPYLRKNYLLFFVSLPLFSLQFLRIPFLSFSSGSWMPAPLWRLIRWRRRNEPR